MIKCSVCINTYKRPFLLKKLLESINIQVVDNDIEIEIIVVDNDPEKQAEPIIAQSINSMKYPIYYFTQAEKNISLTRNKAVNSASGYYLLFIDDDEYADPFWIMNLVKCIKQYDADAAFGKLVPYFNKISPRWVEKWGLFSRPCSKTGDYPKFTYTGNCIVKNEVIKTIEGPFNPEYGLTGGEDTFLFGVLHQQGFKLISCQEAIAYDYFPPERSTIKWLLKRGFRTGNAYTRRKIKFSKNKFKTKALLLIKALISIVFYVFMLSVTFFIPKLCIFWSIKVLGKIGHLSALTNYYPEEYKKNTPSEFSGNKAYTSHIVKK